MDEQKDSRKYFSMKIGSSRLLGVPLEVDINQSPEKKVIELTGSYKIEYMPAGEYSCYVLIEKEKNEPLLQMIINEEGNLKVTSNNEWAIAITPIDKKRANDLVDRINEGKSPFRFGYGPDGI